MSITTGRRTAIQRPIVWLLALVVLVLLVFAVEPTTSTELDVREGRGVAAVHTVASRATSAVVDMPVRPTTYALVRAVSLLALLAVVVVWSQTRTTQGLLVRDRILVRGSAARRGPPARV